MITWNFGPDALLVVIAGLLALCTILALDYWIVRDASRINGH